MPLLKTLRTIACKVEGTIGTPESLSAADGALHVYDLMIQAEIENIQRESSNTFGYLQSSSGPRKGTATFKADLQLTGAAAPAWLSTLLQGCGYVNDGGVYAPISEGLSATSSLKSLTIASYQDGVIKTIAGAVGNFKIMAPTGKLVTMEFEFQGVWQPPVDGAMIEPVYSTERPVRYADAAANYDGQEHCIENLEFDAGNEIIMRECPDTVAGFKSGLIVNRTPKLTLNPEAQLVADYDSYGKWVAGTEAAFSTSFSSVLIDESVATMSLSAPKAQIVNVQEGDRNKLVTDEIELQLNRNGVNIDEDVAIAFS